VRPHLAAARRWNAARRRQRTRLRALGAADGEPLAVGQTVLLNTNTDDPCDGATPSPGRIVALGKSAVVVADDANPLGGYTDEDYRQFAAVFDSIIDPVDRRNFG